MKSVSDFIWFALFFSSEIGEKVYRGFHENQAKIHANRRTFSQISGGPISELREPILIIFEVLERKKFTLSNKLISEDFCCTSQMPLIYLHVEEPPVREGESFTGVLD